MQASALPKWTTDRSRLVSAFALFLVWALQSHAVNAQETSITSESVCTTERPDLCLEEAAGLVERPLVEQQWDTAASRYLTACLGGADAGCTNATSLALGGMFSDPENAAVLAAHLHSVCHRGVSSNACGNLSRLYGSGVGIGFDADLRTSLATIGCDDGDPLGCYVLAFVSHLYPELLELPLERTVELYLLACRGGFMQGCYLAASFPGAGQEGALALNDACSGGNPAGCAALGQSLYSAKPNDPARALELSHQSCLAGSWFGCSTLLFFSQGADPDVAETMLGWLNAHCERGVGRACADEVRWTIDPEDPFALRAAGPIMRAACEQAVPNACHWVALGYHAGDYGAPDPALALDFARRACDLRFGRGCDLMGFLLAHTATPSLGEAVAALERGCDRHYLPSCRTLAEGGYEGPSLSSAITPDTTTRARWQLCRFGDKSQCENVTSESTK